MTDQFCYVPTGERRQPRKGEWYFCTITDGVREATFDYPPECGRHIYRRVPFAVVLGLVEACEVAAAEIPEDRQAVDDVRAALAAARESGIQPKEPTK